MNEMELKVAAFTKMAKGEPLSVSDAQRVFNVILNLPGDFVDTQNQAQLQQFYAQLKEGLQRRYMQ